MWKTRENAATPEDFEARVKAYGQSLQGLPLTMHVEPGDDGGGWIVGPPCEPTAEDFELALGWVQLVCCTERKRYVVSVVGGDAPPSLGVPKLTYAADYLIESIQGDGLLSLWQDLLNDGTFYRPDYLAATVATALDGHLDDLLDSLTEEVVHPQGALTHKFGDSKDHVANIMKNRQPVALQTDVQTQVA